MLRVFIRIAEAWRVLVGTKKVFDFASLPVKEVSDEDSYRLRYEEQMKNEIIFLRSLVKGTEKDQISHVPHGIDIVEPEAPHKISGHIPFSSLRPMLEKKLREKHAENMKREAEKSNADGDIQ